jgi:4-amino-4-deoxy-L-arabinose transferase-like glycosyltransferase
MHVPDEISHVTYVQDVAESGELPLVTPDQASYSAQARNLLTGLEFTGVVGRIDSRPPWTDVEEARLRTFEARGGSRDPDNANTASANPPLYYLLQAPVYWATPSGFLLDKVFPMRLVSVLLGAITVLAVFLFLRELLPRSPWLWPAGALVCAFQPLFGFISSGVNADALLFAASALTFLGMARILRQGLTVRRAAFLGAAVAAGMLSKPLFLGLVPAAALAVLVAAWRAHDRSPRELLAPLGIAAAVAAVPVLAYHLIGGAAFDHPYFPRGSTVGESLATDSGSPRDQLSYIWQLWLPRLPIFAEQFPGGLPLHRIWIAGFLGRFGWLDYGFASWVLTVFTVVCVVVALAAVATVASRRDKMHGRWVELGVYVVAVAGIAGAIGAHQYQAVLDNSPAFTQARYLLPLFALYGGLVVVALRLAGRRVGPYLAIAAVTLAAVHGLSAMLLTVSRYYA